MLWLVSWLTGCAPAPEGACSELGKVILFDDADGDGFGDPTTEVSACALTPKTTTRGGDCDDDDETSFPDAAEQCDNADNDCDGTIDEEMPLKTWYEDADGDGVGDEDRPIQSCAQPDSTALEAGDCDDGDPDVSPFGVEICNGADDDCDGRTDDGDPSIDPATWNTWWLDADGDGAGDPLTTILACNTPEDATDNADDCDDQDPSISPGAAEICNSEDDDCDGLYDESDPDLDPDLLSTWWYDGDGDGAGDPNITAKTCGPPLFYVNNDADCDDDEPLIAAPAPWVLDADGDGVGAGAATGALCAGPTPDWVPAAAGSDCEPDDPTTYPGAPDSCGDTLDQNCDGFDAFCTVGLAETCAESQLQPHATTGVWPLSAALVTDDIDVAAGQCTQTASNGRDGFVQIDLGPLETATIVHSANTDSSPYILTDCALASSCEGGAENESADGSTETLRWQNTTLLETTVFAVFDCADGACTSADGALTVSSAPVLADTCLEAEGWTPLGAGTLSLFATVSTFVDDLNLPGNGCTGFNSPGKDGFLPVLVAPGQTLEVAYTQTVNDASLYFLTDCASAASCIDGKDNGLAGDPERLLWTNPDVTDQVVYIAFDCYAAACNAFSATVTID